MVSKYNDFVSNGAIDDSYYIPEWVGHILLLVHQVERDALWGWADVVVDAFVSKTSALPELIE